MNGKQRKLELTWIRKQNRFGLDMIRRVLKNLRVENRVERLSRGRNARWQGRQAAIWW